MAHTSMIIPMAGAARSSLRLRASATTGRASRGGRHNGRRRTATMLRRAGKGADATSFLRLARVPFEGTAADGARLALLRVEVDSVADVGSITPHLGGASFRYDPLPARMISRRKRLRLVYFDGQKPRMLDLAEAMSLAVA
jgi:hypothetical protein